MTEQPLFVSASRGLVAALGGEVVLKVLGFASTFIVLQQLGPYQYGLWQLLLSTGIAFGVVTVPGIASMLVADVSREIGKGEKARANGILLRAISAFSLLGLVGGGALLIAAPIIHDISGIDMVFYMQLLAIAVMALGVKQSYQLVFQSRLNYVHAQIMKAIDRLSYFVGIVIFLLYLGSGFEGVVYAYVISTCTALFVYAPYMVRLIIEASRNYERAHWLPFWEAVFMRGKWALGTDVVNAAIGSLWPWMVGYFLSVEAVGIIGVTILALGQIAAFVPISYVLRSVLPRTVSDPQRTRDWLFRSMKFSLWGNIIGAVGAFCACIVLFPVFFPQHLAALPLLAALLITLPLRGMATTAAEWFFASGSQRELFLVSTVPKIALYTLLPLFLWRGGLLGYALWYILSSDVVLYARIRVIGQRLGGMVSATFLLHADEVDIDIVKRVRLLVSQKVRRTIA